MRIFDALERTGLTLAYDTEDSFQLMNCTACPQSGRVRDLVDEWFS